MPELKPCPFCGGGEVTIAEAGYKNENCFFVTRGHSKTRKNCKCRVFMESEPYRKDEGDSKEKIRNDLVEAWNRRAHDTDTICGAYAQAAEDIRRREKSSG